MTKAGGAGEMRTRLRKVCYICNVGNAKALASARPSEKEISLPITLMNPSQEQDRDYCLV